jgi:hypothetical protein
MNINFFGNSFLKIESKNLTIAVDPFLESVGKVSKFKADILLSTNSNTLNEKGVLGEPFVLKNAGEIEEEGVFIEGIYIGDFIVYKIICEEMNILVLGEYDLGELNEDVLDDIGSVDILLVGVNKDVKNTLNIISQVQPKVVVPIMYKQKGIKNDCLEVEKFTSEYGVDFEEVSKLNIRKNNLPTEEDTRSLLYLINS